MSQHKIHLFIQKNIGFSLGKIPRDAKYWHLFYRHLKTMIEKCNTLSLTKILDSAYVLKKNKFKSNSKVLKRRKITNNTPTVSFFHFLCQDMCNYWPPMHDKHLNATYNIIKLILQNGANPLLQYHNGNNCTYSYESILLLFDAFERNFRNNQHKISQNIQFVLSHITNYDFHPPIFTFYTTVANNKIQINHNHWLFLGCNITNKSEERIFNTLSPHIITFLLKRNHTLFEFKNTTEIQECINNITMNLIHLLPKSMIISLCFVNFILPSIHKHLSELFMSSKNSISNDILSIIMEYTLFGYNKYNKTQNKLFTVLPPNINENTLIKYVLENGLKEIDILWWKWFAETAIPTFSLSQINQMKYYTSENISEWEWSQFMIKYCAETSIIKLLLIYGGIVNPTAMFNLIKCHYKNMDNLQIILSCNYLFDLVIIYNRRLLVKIFNDKELNKANLLYICNHICEHVQSDAYVKPISTKDNLNNFCKDIIEWFVNNPNAERDEYKQNELDDIWNWKEIISNND
eukprot:99113_1